MELAEILWYKSLTKSGIGCLDDSADKGTLNIYSKHVQRKEYKTLI